MREALKIIGVQNYKLSPKVASQSHLDKWG